MAKIIELIWTTEYRGDGTEKDPCRCVPQLWTKDGKLVAQRDPSTGENFFNDSELCRATQEPH